MYKPEPDRKTYKIPTISAINTGKPTPTLTPMIILLLTPPVFPLTRLLTDVDTEFPPVDAGATKDTGVPLVALKAF
jgi:hypothetical protein